MPRETGRKLIAQNKKARHDYSILDTYEVGLVLTGTEVKSLRAGRACHPDQCGANTGRRHGRSGVHCPAHRRGKRSANQSLGKDADLELGADRS